MDLKEREWFATKYLHIFCATSKDLRLLRERGQKEFEEGQKNLKNRKERGMGSHFGSKYDGFCLEF